MNHLSNFVAQIRELYLPEKNVDAESPPDVTERLVTIRTLSNAIEALEAFDEAVDRETRGERIYDTYAVFSIIYTLESALQKLAREVLGKPFPVERG